MLGIGRDSYAAPLALKFLCAATHSFAIATLWATFLSRRWRSGHCMRRLVGQL